MVVARTLLTRLFLLLPTNHSISRTTSTIALCSTANTSTTKSSSADSDDSQQQQQQQVPPLVVIGDKELLTPCPPFDLTKLDKENDDSIILDDSSSNMIDMLRKCQKTYGGIGIAACQVGWRTRIFCMGIDDEDIVARARYPNAPPFPFQVWINPTITPLPERGGTSWFWEGCLSVPGIRGWVERPNCVLISGWNEHGEYIKEKELDGLPARVAQHEFDHLDGILFPQRALPGTLLPVKSFEIQDRWPDNWPTPGSRTTNPGAFSDKQ